MPKFVNVRKISGLTEILNGSFESRLKYVYHNNGIFNVIVFIISAIISKITRNRGRYYRTMVSLLPQIQENYDYVISYTMPDSICIPYVVSKFHAKEKWMWSHIDVEYYKNYELKGMRTSYAKFDKIVNVSLDAKQSFDRYYPMLKDKSILVYNHIDEKRILEKSLEYTTVRFDYSYLNLLTVGRITYQKGQDIIVEIAEKLFAKGIKFKWYLLGPDSDETFFNNLMKSIKEKNLTDQIVYLGQSNNPYAYMRQCDIYVQPSRYEGYCTTITEACVLCKPIVATNVSGVNEQLYDGVTGLISPISIDDITQRILLLANNPELRNTLSTYLKKVKNGNQMHTFEDVICLLLN